MFIATHTTPASTVYTIRKVADQLVCDCKDHLYRSNGEKYVCKHIAELVADVVEFSSMAAKSKAAEKIIGA